VTAKKGFFARPSAAQCRDAGLALVLIGLIALQITGAAWIGPALIAVTLLVMVWPRAFHPFAIVWFALSEALGTVVSKIILSVLFFVLVTPIGLARRLLGGDPMQRRRWRDGDGSVFTARDHQASAQDLEQLF
jgi:hypothetical protein